MTRPRCGNDPRAQLTDGDRRAVEDFKAYLAERAALRDRIAETIARRDGHDWGPGKDSLPSRVIERYTHLADAVLAVLPEPADQAAELTAEEARALADDLGLQLYRAQDALAFVAECCTIAEREQRAITTSDVREWLKGAQCGRQLATGLRRMADETPAAAADVEHCVHDRNVHTRHHHQPVTGCPWCTATAEQQNGTQPDFTSPIAGRIEVRDPCPWCGDRQLIPRSQMREHVARLHPDARQNGAAS